MGKTLEKGTVCDFCTCDFFSVVYGFAHSNVLLGEILGHLGFCGVFRWQGTWASWAGMLLDYKKGDRASANSCPQVASSEACPHCISQPVHPAWGEA